MPESKPVILSESKIDEIEARNLGMSPVIDALCATVRALRTERLEVQRALASSVLNDPTEDDDVPYSTTELVEGIRWLIQMKEAKQVRVTALREQLAESKKQHLAGMAEKSIRINELKDQLAQLTQERDDAQRDLELARQSLLKMTDAVEKQL